MQTNWIIIGFVIIIGILLVIFLVRRNLKDEKDVMEHFNEESSTFPDDDSEFNDEK